MDNDKTKVSKDTDNEKSIRKSSGKAVREHLWAFLLVAFGILLYLALNNMGSIGRGIVTFTKILSPLFIGALLAIFLNCLMVAIENLIHFIGKKLSKNRKKAYSPNIRTIEIISLILTVIIAVLLIYIIVNSIVPQLIESVKSIITQIQANMPRYLELLDRIEEYGIDTDRIREWLSSLDFTEIIKRISDNAGNIINTVISSASSIITGTFTAVTSVIFALYVLGNKKYLASQSKKIGYAFLKKETVDRIIGVGRLTSETFSKFISGQCLDAIILGLMMFFTMTIFGFPYALACSSMITVTAIIPYIGAFLGAAFGILLMVINSPLQALLFVVLFIVVQQIDNHVVYPRVVGGSVGLPAIWTFIAVIVGGALSGVVGMIVYIPIFSVGYSLISKTVDKRLADRGIIVEDPPHNRDDDKEDQSPVWNAISSAAKKVIAFFKKIFRKKKPGNKSK